MKDICGVPPEGTGILHLRKSIIQTKYKYDASSEDRQTVWKRMIINFIERYFYLVCFAAYAKVCYNAMLHIHDPKALRVFQAFGKAGFEKSFVEYVNEKEGLRYEHHI